MQAGLLSLASLAGLVAAQASSSSSSANVTLAPVTASSSSSSSSTNGTIASVLSPSVNVSLPYGGSTESDGSTTTAAHSVINVDLTTSHASVLLEAIASIVSVACSADAVIVTFDDAKDLAAAYAEWSGHPLLVLVTNHMGDCDTELERGFFTADSFVADASALTIVATTQKSSISAIGCESLFFLSSTPTSAIERPREGI